MDMFNTLAKTVETTVTEVATSEVVTEAAKIGFSTDNVQEALLCSVAGMVGIFIVVGIIILSVSVLNKIGAKKK
ncbi:MAG: hypothetical protein IKT55_02500 [Clostridia bacterium]|nr:hypothetical protein [Clostridia bacterium]